MSRGFLLGVNFIEVPDPATEGLTTKWVPDLESNVSQYIQRIGQSNRFWVRYGEHSLLMTFVGIHVPSATTVFICHGSARIGLLLAHLGAKLLRLRDLRQRPAILSWLRSRGLRALRRVHDGEEIGVVLSDVIAGQGDPLSASLDNDWTDDDGVTIVEYEVA